MRYFLFCSYFLVVTSIFCQNEFDVAKISSLLKTNANAVIRIQDERFKVITVEKSIKSERLVVTILNEKGADQFSSFSRSYDSFVKIKKIEGLIYDSSGKKIESLKKSEIKDYSNFDGGNEITDSRQKVAFFNKKTYSYPYTIEFSYIEERNNGMFYPIWSPLTNEHVSVEKSVFSLIKPSMINFRYKEKNLLNTVSISRTENEDTYIWEIQDVVSTDLEDYITEDHFPVVFTAPNEFKVEEYFGNASSWKDIGIFYATLNENKDQLSEITKLKIKELVSNETDTLKLIEKLYNYVQSTTRYISVQLGVGGWQTISAMDVAQKGYGDCKGLSNFMMSILKEAGIKSNRALILAGNEFYQIQPDFPCNRFNHAIVCVPLKKDTIWLDCTSQTSAMGYMGSFTGNRKALVINNNGGVLVNTVNYLSKDNIQNRKITIDIDEQGNAKVVANTVYGGIKQEYPGQVVNQLNKERQREFIMKNLHLTNFELLNFSFKEYKNRLPKIEQNLELKVNKIISTHGSPILITPNFLPNYINVPVLDNDRKYSFTLDPTYYNYSMTDTVIYNFSNHISLESLLYPANLTSKFGEFKTTFSFKNNQLIYCRNLILTGGTFANTDYQSWISFIKQINKNDRQRVSIVLKK